MGERKWFGVTVGLSQKDRARLKVLAVVAAVMIGVVVLAHVIRRDADGRRGESEEVERDPRRGKVGVAIMAVKRFLKDPDSASFPHSSEWSVTDVGAGRWRVSGVVTATNGFNARTHQPADVEMIEQGADVRVVYVRLGGKVLLDVR